MSDQAAFAKFEDGWEQDGASANGMPKFRPVLIIRLSKPPYLQVRREATDEDIEHYAEPYKLYQKLKAGRDISEVTGYPLALWAAITVAEFEQLIGHGIITVEQLAKIGERKGAVAAKVPEPIMQLAARAKRMMELQKSQGRYEAVINELTAERDQLVEQLRESHAALSAANALANNLQMRIAGIGTMLPERAA
jgi:hypothetical protein